MLTEDEIRGALREIEQRRDGLRSAGGPNDPVDDEGELRWDRVVLAPTIDRTTGERRALALATKRLTPQGSGATLAPVMKTEHEIRQTVRELEFEEARIQHGNGGSLQKLKLRAKIRALRWVLREVSGDVRED